MSKICEHTRLFRESFFLGYKDTDCPQSWIVQLMIGSINPLNMIVPMNKPTMMNSQTVYYNLD